MKRLLSLMVLCCQFATAQELRFTMGYSYLYSSVWDEAIGLYNVSRPFLETKQPLLIHGGHISTSYLFKNTKNLKHGVDVSYSFFRSYAANKNLTNGLNLHFICPSYLLHFENKERFGNFFSEAKIGVLMGAVYRRVNGQALEVDDKKLKALGIGSELNIHLGYHIYIHKNSLSPFVGLSYSYYYAPNYEAVFNQTTGNLDKDWTGLLQIKTGLTWYFIANVVSSKN
jgi:hypothetical protein